MIIQKKTFGEWGWVGSGGGGQGGSEKGIEVFVKIKKKSVGGCQVWGSGWM